MQQLYGVVKTYNNDNNGKHNNNTNKSTIN